MLPHTDFFDKILNDWKIVLVSLQLLLLGSKVILSHGNLDIDKKYDKYTYSKHYHIVDEIIG